jgi:hypothetical protein
VRAKPNRADPHDYYAELGVSPSASREEIRAALRRLYLALHPDTGIEPDSERLTRVRNIAEVLLDDVSRSKYDHTPPGQRLMDKVYAEELSKLTELRVASRPSVAEALRPQNATLVGRFDYFSIGYKTTDSLKAQQWYHYLIPAADEGAFRGRLRLLLWDGERPAWQCDQEILMVPRDWEPSSFAAKTLVARVIGSSDISNLTTDAPQVSTLSSP